MKPVSLSDIHIGRFIPLLLIVLHLEVMGQSTPVVSKISVEGGQVTKEYIIRREIQHPLDVQLDSTIASEDRDRIDNLAIFSSVVWDTISQKDGSVELVYRVLESWRILPGASPAYWEDKGWSLIGGLRILNFRGRNQAFGVGGSIGALQMFGFSFSDPWIAGNHISLSMNLGKNLFVHPFLPYVQSTESFEANLGRWFGYRWKVQAGFELEHKQFSEESDTLSFTYIAPQGSVIYDTRDIYRDPSRGGMITQSFYSMIDLTQGDGNRLVWTQSVSQYWSPVQGQKKLTLGIGVKLATSFGSMDEVWLNYFGGSKTVRGWSVPNRDDYVNPLQSFRFGNHQFIFSAEARQTIIPTSTVSSRIFNVEYGLTGVVFLDIGYTSRQLQDLLNFDPLLGTGLGIRMPIPGGVLRLDLGWSFYSGEFVSKGINFDLGQKF